MNYIKNVTKNSQLNPRIFIDNSSLFTSINDSNVTSSYLFGKLDKIQEWAF